MDVHNSAWQPAGQDPLVPYCKCYGAGMVPNGSFLKDVSAALPDKDAQIVVASIQFALAATPLLRRLHATSVLLQEAPFSCAQACSRPASC